MTDCPHIKQANIQPAIVLSSLTNAFTKIPDPSTVDSYETRSTFSRSVLQTLMSIKQQNLRCRSVDELQCQTCRKSKQSLWACLTCGTINCGRNDGRHAVNHYNQSKHAHCISPSDLSCFCYLCDEFVTNGEEVLNPIRDAIRLTMHPDSHFPQVDETDVASDAGSTTSDKGKKRKRITLINGSAKPKKKIGPKYKTITGLTNLGNTCFMNSVLQALGHTDALREFVNEDQGKLMIPIGNQQNSIRPHTRRSSSSTPVNLVVAQSGVSLWNDFYSLIREMLFTEEIVTSPSVFLHSLWTVLPIFRGYQQQDAQEFLRYLLERLHAELDPTSDKGSVIQSMFMGKMQSTVTCLTCHTSTFKEDAFMDLSLAIPDVFANRRNKVEEKQHPCTILDCLSEFFGAETLDETEKYKCDYCDDMERVSKKFTITQLPPVLCLHIKRFKYTRSMRTKIDTWVEFPILDLDMSQFCSMGVKDTIYDLYSVLVHHGYPGSGHYMSYIWDHDAATWFEMNDNVAKPTDAGVVSEQTAYVLFYKRRLPEKWSGLEKLQLTEQSPRSSPRSPTPRSPPAKSPLPKHSSRPTSPRTPPKRQKSPVQIVDASDTEPDLTDVDIETVESSDTDWVESNRRFKPSSRPSSAISRTKSPLV